MSDPVALLLNPAAGRGGSGAVAAAFRREFGDGAQVLATVARGGDTATLDAALRALPDRAVLCIAGGDGTLHAAFNALARARRSAPWPRLAHLATGSANDGARALAALTGRAHDRADLAGELRAIAARVARQDAGHAADAGRVRLASGAQHLFANFVAAGSPADWALLSARPWVSALKRASAPLAYQLCSLGVIARRRIHDLEVGLDQGAPVAQPTFAWFAAKARFLGGGIDLGPSVRLDSGRLHVLAIPAAPRRALVRLLAASKRGQGPALATANRARLRLPAGSHLNLDGEVVALGADGAAEVDLLPSRAHWL